MKRILTALLACVLLLGIASAEAWQPVATAPQALPEDAQAAFDGATAQLLGASYVPVALLSVAEGTQGDTSYCILCQITPVVPDAAPTWNLVYLHTDAEGNAEITNVWEIYIDRHAQPADQAA